MLTQQQIDARKHALFATDAAPALGLSKYSTPVAVWLEKTGQAEPPDLSDNEAVHMGNVMEPIIARLYADRTGTLPKYIGDYTAFHQDNQFMGSHFDYVSADRTLIEVKNFSAMRQKEFGEPGSGDVPMDVLMQCIHEATVYDTDRVDVAVLFGGQSFCIYPLTIDREAKDKLVSLERDFWEQYVIPVVAPAPRTEEEVRALFRRDNGQVIVADAAMEHTAAQLAMIRSSIKELEGMEEKLKVSLEAYMGEHSTLAASTGEILATWKRSKDGTKFDAKAFEKSHPALYAQFLKATEGSRRFLLK